jgi:hypothetical protein
MYTIAEMSDGYAFYWQDLDGSTNSIHDKPQAFTQAELEIIVNNDPKIIYKLAYLDRGLMICQINDKGETVKCLRRSDFNVSITVNENPDLSKLRV